jgi:spore coat polysaccharide biosynthesis protein SpsF
MDETRVAAIIQARMTSSRLPGKVLLPLAGQPVLWHVVHRLRQCRTVDVVAVVTSDRPEDDALVAWCAADGVPVFRGSEDNVLERYAVAVDALRPKVILRVTGDSPLIDPTTVDQVVAALLREGADYCVADPAQPCIHEGFSPFPRSAFERLRREATTDPVAVEHVSAYIGCHPESFRHHHVTLPPDHQFSGARISVDTPADLEFLETLYRELGAAPGEIDIAEVVRLLRQRPELLAINAHVRQKTITEASFRLVIRCDGYPEIGLGHVVRSLAVARQLRDAHGIGVSLALRDREPGPALVREAGFPLDLWDGRIPEGAWLRDVLGDRRAHALLLDVRTGLAPDQLAAWRRSGLLVAVLDDPSDRRLAADLAFYPPVPQVREMDWSLFSGDLCAGWDWLPLRPGFDRKLTEPHHPEPCVVVTMGGSDPAGLSLRALRALERLDGLLRIRLILGRGFAHRAALETLLPTLRRQTLEILEDLADMPAALADADLAVAAFGVTAWELAALGVPAILLGLSADHARSAESLHEAGMARSLGEHTMVSDADLAAAVDGLLADPVARRAMRAACATVDGRGAGRIAVRLVTRLTGRVACIERSGERS